MQELRGSGHSCLWLLSYLLESFPPLSPLIQSRGKRHPSLLPPRPQMFAGEPPLAVRRASDAAKSVGGPALLSPQCVCVCRGVGGTVPPAS